MTNNKKLLITIIVLSIVLLVSALSMVIVLVATTQTATSAVNIKFVGTGVNVRLSANAYLGDTTYTFMNGDSTTLEITPTSTTGSLNLTDNTALDADNRYIVYEYTFQNLSTTNDAKITLAGLPGTQTNVNLGYASSFAKATDPDSIDFVETNTPVLLPAYTQTARNYVYVYVKASIDNMLHDSALNGEFVWEMVMPSDDEVVTYTIDTTSCDAVEIAGNVTSSVEDSYLCKTLSGTDVTPDIVPLQIDSNFQGWTYSSSVAMLSDDNVVSNTLLANNTTTLVPIFLPATNGLSYTLDLDYEGYCIYNYTISTTDTQLVIPDVVVIDDVLDKVVRVRSRDVESNAILYNNTTVTSIVFGRYIGSIGSYAFHSSLALEELNLSGSITSVGYHSFDNCTALSNIVFGKNFKTIGSYSFQGCTSLTSLNIPDNVTAINSHAFYGCTGLTSVANGSGLTFIDIYVFAVCSNLSSVDFDNKVTEISDSLFRGCSKLTSIDIPSSVTSIGPYAFFNCSKLEDVIIPDDVTSIGTYAFGRCTSFQSVKIPNNVTSIGGEGFYKCTSLTSVTIGSSVTSIGGWAFSGCTNLTSLTIPSSVVSIGAYAFSGSGLTSLIFSNTTGWSKSSSFSGTYTAVDSKLLSDPATNATNFVSISEYYNYYWKRT